MPQFISRTEVYFKQNAGGKGKTRKQNLSIPLRQPRSAKGHSQGSNKGPGGKRQNQAQAGGLQTKPFHTVSPPTARSGLLSKGLLEKPQ